MLPLDFCMRIVRELSDSASKLTMESKPGPRFDQPNSSNINARREIFSSKKGGVPASDLETQEWFWLGDRRVVEDPEYSVKLVAKNCSSSLSVVFLAFFFLLSWTYPTRS